MSDKDQNRKNKSSQADTASRRKKFIEEGNKEIEKLGINSNKTKKSNSGMPSFLILLLIIFFVAISAFLYLNYSKLNLNL